MRIGTILDHIDSGTIALPEFQRGYVWNRSQVRKLMDSLYKRHPIGSLLVWVTKVESTQIRGDGGSLGGMVKLLLDGQQRVTSLYGIIRGRPPRFFDGNAQAFTGLHFDVENEVFEFCAPMKMQDNPLWVDVTELMQKGVVSVGMPFVTDPRYKGKTESYLRRLNQIEQIKDVNLHIEEVTGSDKGIDEVVEIFNNVNSGGTRLSQADLALAKTCAQWPEARDEFKNTLERWRVSGYAFKLDWLLRNINAVVTGEAKYSALDKASVEDIQSGLKRVEESCNFLLNLISTRLGLDHNRVIGARPAFAVMSRYVDSRGGALHDPREQDRLLYWYIHSLLWGRFSGSVESVLDRDLKAIESADEPRLNRLISEIESWRGSLTVRPGDFAGSTVGARFYPMLYLLSRVYGAKDWLSGNRLSSHLLGRSSALHLHHIFPKRRLYDRDHTVGQVNAIANFSFLTQEANLRISDRAPEDYMEWVEENHPGALASHWIPMDRELWKLDRYVDFLEARRELLAEAANKFLSELLEGKKAEPAIISTPTAISTVVSEEDEEIIDLVEWAVSVGLPEPELHMEVVGEDDQVISILDIAWPRGIQEGLSEPLGLLTVGLSSGHNLQNLGYRIFTRITDLKRYLEAQIMNSASD